MNEQRRHERAFTRIDLIIIVITTAVLALIPLSAWATSRARASRVQCLANLKTIGWAFHDFAAQQNGQYPLAYLMRPIQGGPWNPGPTPNNYHLLASFAIVSNQFHTPKAVVCPSDSRVAATTFNLLTNFFYTNVSYFVGIDVSEQSPRMFLSGDRNMGSSPGGYYSGNWTVGTNNAFVNWANTMHERTGNVLFPDGSVPTFGDPQLRDALRKTGDVMNNRLLFTSSNFP